MKVFQIRQDDRFAWYETDQEQMERMVNVCGWQGRVLELASTIAADAVSVTAAELSCIINWLEGGRDPKDAAKELRLYCERAWTGAQPVQQPAPVASLNVATWNAVDQLDAAPVVAPEPVAYAVYGISGGKVYLHAVKLTEDAEDGEWKTDTCHLGDYWAGNEPMGVIAAPVAAPVDVPAASVQPFVPAGYANETEFLRQQLKDSRTANKAAQLVIAELQAGKPDSGRDAALAGLLREALGIIDCIPSAYGLDLASRINAALAAHPANVAQVGGLTAEQITDAIGDGLDEARDEISSVAWAAITKRLSAILGAAKEGPTT